MLTSASVAFIIISGQMPKVLRISVDKETGMMIPARGMARRFVSRKCCGKVRNHSHAIGPVATWQAIDKEAEFHIHPMIPSFSAPGHRFLILG